MIDDLQHAEPTLLDLIEGLADHSRGAPILLAGIARPELLDARPTWGGGKAERATVSLEPLDSHDSGLLLAESARRLCPRAAATRSGRRGGRRPPLFVEELLTMLSEQSRMPGGDDELSLPPTVQVLLAARLERLPDTERLVLGCGAVEGETFHADALAPSRLSSSPTRPERRARGAAAQGPAAAGRAADRRQRGLSLPARPRPRGRLRRAAQGPAAARHEAFAAWLEQAAVQRLAELEEVLAYHLEQAFRLYEELGGLDRARRALGERAGRLLASAGRRASERATSRRQRTCSNGPPRCFRPTTRSDSGS